jgi:hypothetical protein
MVAYNAGLLLIYKTQNMRKIITLLFILTLSVALKAQVVQWGAQMGNAGYCGVKALVTDAAGNVYSTGYFAGTVDFNPGAGAYNLISTGLYDAFIQKLDANGNFVWAAKMGQTQDESGERLVLDNAGNIVVVGTSNGLFNLGLGRQDIGIWKFSNAGAMQWSKKIGFNYYDYGTAVSIDEADNIYVTGTFENTVDFNPGGTPQSLTSTGNLRDMFVLKLLANGTFRWVKQIATATGNPESIQQTVYNPANDHVYLGGVFYGKTDFNPSVAVADTFFLNTGAVGVKSVFISEIDTAGNFVRAVAVGNQTEILFGNMALNAGGTKLCVTGGFRSNVDFDPGAGTSFMDAGLNVGTAVYVLQVNADLTFQSAFQLGSQTPFTNSVGLCAKFDGGDNLYLGGRLEGIVDLAPDAAVVNYTSAGQQDMFLVKINPAGELVYGNGAGGAANEVVSTLDVNTFGDTFIGGAFTGTLDFSMNGGGYPMTAPGLGSAYLVKYAPSFPLPIHNLKLTAELMASQKVLLSWTGNRGLDVAFYELESSQDAMHWNLICSREADHAASANWQYRFIDQAVQQGTTYYRLREVSREGTFIYSDIQSVQRTADQFLSSYPNPCTMTLNVNLPQNDLMSTISVYSMDGRLLLSEQTSTDHLKLDVNALTNGTYFLRVFNAEKQLTTKFVKQ